MHPTLHGDADSQTHLENHERHTISVLRRQFVYESQARIHNVSVHVCPFPVRSVDVVRSDRLFNLAALAVS